MVPLHEQHTLEHVAGWLTAVPCCFSYHNGPAKQALILPGWQLNMLVTTTQCSRFGQPEFVLEADESQVPGVYLANAVQIIESMVAHGSVLQPGQTVQIGWMITQIQAHDSRHLTLLEPDMKAFPIEWVPGITQTLRQMMMQLFMLDSVSLRNEMDVATVLQSLIVCTKYFEPDFFMSRSRGTSDSESGWFVGCCNEDHDHNAADNLRCVSVYEAFLHQRGIQEFMSFPVESMIVMDQETGMAIFKDGKAMRIQPGSFHDGWLSQQVKPNTPSEPS